MRHTDEHGWRIDMAKLAEIINKSLKRKACFTGNADELRLRRLSTGMLGLDISLGGGLVRGRYHQFWGGESAGKTTATLLAIANIQKACKHVNIFYVDVEHSFDPVWAAFLGVDLERLDVLQPMNGDEACDVIAAVIPECGADIIVLDSVAALTSDIETSSDMSTASVATIPRLLGKFFRVTTASLQTVPVDKQPGVVLINQRREKIMAFGDPETQPGGNSLKHFSSITCRFRRGNERTAALSFMAPDIQGDSDKSGGKTAKPKTLPVVAYEIKIKATKNKTATSTPVMRATIGLINYDGLRAGQVDGALDLLRIGTMSGIITRGGGGYFSWENHDGEQRKFHGIAAAKNFLRECYEDDEYLDLYARVLREVIGVKKFNEIQVAGFKTAGAKKTRKVPSQRPRGKKTTRKWQPMA